MFQRILVGTDGSGTAGAAVAHAAELAKIGGSELIVVSAYKQPDDVPPPFGMPEGQHTAEIGKAILQDVEKRYGGDAKLRTVLREGNPVDAIIEWWSRQPPWLIRTWCGVGVLFGMLVLSAARDARSR